jgi:hypothetical protein
MSASERLMRRQRQNRLPANVSLTIRRQIPRNDTHGAVQMSSTTLSLVPVQHDATADGMRGNSTGRLPIGLALAMTALLSAGLWIGVASLVHAAVGLL